MKDLCTITLGMDDDNPTVTLCPGHVDVKTFADAFTAEGWSDTEPADFGELRHEYWRETETGGWEKSNVTDLKAQPVTVSDW